MPSDRKGRRRDDPSPGSTERPLVQKPIHAPEVTTESLRSQNRRGPVSTRDRELIKQWATQHQAEPATGEATESGGAKVSVHDGATGLRFNFPGAGRFRPISWDEWFSSFDLHQLTFVFESEGEAAAAPSGRYRIVRIDQWREVLQDE